MNLASFYLCLFMLKTCKYLVALYTHHFRERFDFPVFFFSFKSVFGQFTTGSSSFHPYSATSSLLHSRFFFFVLGRSVA